MQDMAGDSLLQNFHETDMRRQRLIERILIKLADCQYTEIFLNSFKSRNIFLESARQRTASAALYPVRYLIDGIVVALYSERLELVFYIGRVTKTV